MFFWGLVTIGVHEEEKPSIFTTNVKDDKVWTTRLP